MARLAIVGIFYSGYINIWKDFVSLYKKNWNSKMFNFYISCDSDSLTDFEGFRVISCGKNAEYSRRVQEAISQIDADYFLILLEHFFFSKPLNDEKLLDIMEFIEKEQIKYYAMPMADFSGNYKGKKYKNNKIRAISTKAEYTLSCQPAIWSKTFLKRCIGNDNYNAWIFEGIYKESKIAHSTDFLKGCVADLTNPLELKHGVVQGKMLLDTYRFFKNKGYEFEADYTLMSKKNYLRRKFIVFIKKILPYSVQKILKKVFKKKSITDKYIDTINKIMKNMELN